MFGPSFFQNVVKFLAENFGYRPNEVQLKLLKTISKEAERSWKNGIRTREGAEAVAAVKFMMVQLDALTGASPSTKSFIEKHSKSMVKVLAHFPGMSDGALKRLNAIRGRHNLSAVGESGSSVQEVPLASSSRSIGPWSPVSEQEDKSYEEWYQRYKRECAKYHPLMKPNADGVSMLDWLDHEPLKQAFEDNLPPEPLAASFMKNFDPESFGFPKKQPSDFKPPVAHDDLELAVEYFHTVAKFALEKADYHYRSVRVTEPEAAALRQEFCRRKQVGNWIGLFRIAKIEAHAVSFTKHALRSGDGNKIHLIGSLYAFANSIEDYQRDMREIRDFLRRELSL